MPAYAVLKRGPDNGRGIRKFTVILRADDGYSETQNIVGDAATLRAAARHFQQQRSALVSPDPVDPTPIEFVDVSPT